MSALALLADPDLLDRSATSDVRALTRAGYVESECAAVGLARWRGPFGRVASIGNLRQDMTTNNEVRSLCGAVAAYRLQHTSRRTAKQGASTGRRGIASSGTSNRLRSIKTL